MKRWNFESDQHQKLPWHLKHLPIFWRPFDFFGLLARMGWFLFLKAFFSFWVRLEVRGDFKKVYASHPKLLLLSNHVSHLDTVALMSSMPFKHWNHFYSVAAQDYFFTNPFFRFFSTHCLGALPLDRNGPKRTGTTLLCVRLLQRLDRIWMLMFPEGTRSKNGELQKFRRGIAMFSQRTETPLLFLSIEGAHGLWPKGNILPKRGKIVVNVGEVHSPSDIETIRKNYESWLEKNKKRAFAESALVKDRIN